jgi:hypothetical protein
MLTVTERAQIVFIFIGFLISSVIQNPSRSSTSQTIVSS